MLTQFLISTDIYVSAFRYIFPVHTLSVLTWGRVEHDQQYEQNEDFEKVAMCLIIVYPFF